MPLARTAAIVVSASLGLALAGCGSPSSPSTQPASPSNNTALLVIQPPTPVQPLAASFTHKRPTFIVADATHTGPSATLTYRFDIATDAAFGNVVATGTVPEAVSQTTFTPPVDLVPGASYVWRAQASDAGQGVTSSFSTPQMFTTVIPDDGTFPYDLTLQIDNLTNCVNGSGLPVSPGNPVPLQSFDANLAVSGDSLLYVLPDPDSTVPLVTFAFQRSGNQVSGTLTGSVQWPGAFHFAVFFRQISAAGITDSVGRLIGTAQGTWDNEGSPAYLYCNVQLGFVLAPH